MSWATRNWKLCPKTSPSEVAKMSWQNPSPVSMVAFETYLVSLFWLNARNSPNNRWFLLISYFEKNVNNICEKSSWVSSRKQAGFWELLQVPLIKSLVEKTRVAATPLRPFWSRSISGLSGCCGDGSDLRQSWSRSCACSIESPRGSPSCPGRCLWKRKSECFGQLISQAKEKLFFTMKED